MSGYYSSAHWRELRERALKRDCYTCVTPGCRQPARTVDHIEARPSVPHPTTFDVLANLRSFCATCDNQTMQRGGKRRGAPKAKGCDASGFPTDPSHSWRKG